MKRLLLLLILLSLSTFGCANNYYNVPATNFAEKVKVLGVAPIFLDEESDIVYPQKELLIPLVTSMNRKYESLLVRKLQSTGNFYAVTPMTDEPKQLLHSLMARREKRDDANIQYNKYFWKKDLLADYMKKNRLDALMVVVVSGLNKSSKIYSSNFMTSLETDFNFLIMTAQILSPDGTVLWEYPNFRSRLLTYYPLINLQYPDFSESEANLSSKTSVRYKTVDGIRRTFEQKSVDWLLREIDEPAVYGRLFNEMISFIQHTGDKQQKGASADDKKLLKGGDLSSPTEKPKNVETQNLAVPATKDSLPATDNAR